VNKPLLKDRFKQATREAILDAASEVLSTDAGTRVRMEDIAASAGIAVGTLYNYFEDRTALVSALLAARMQTLFEALESAPVLPGAASKAVGAGFQSELEQFVLVIGRHFNRNRFLFNILLEDEQRRGIDASAAVRRKTASGELHARVERMMARGIRGRDLQKGDPATYAALFVGMVKGLTVLALSRGGDFPSDGPREIVRVFMSGAGR